MVDRALRLQPRVRQPLLCNTKGERYKAGSFDSVWRHAIGKAVEAGVKRFHFHDLRAKSASDDELDEATKRLGHTSAKMTQRVYVRKPTKVRPLR